MSDDEKKRSTFQNVKSDLEAAVLKCQTHGELKLAVIARLESDEATGEVFGRRDETARQRLMRLSGLTREATFKAALKGVVELGLMTPSQRVYSRGDQKSARYWRRTEAWASRTLSVPDDGRTVLTASGTPGVPDQGTMSVPDEGTLSVPDLYKDTATVTATETAKGGTTPVADATNVAPTPLGIQSGPFPRRVHRGSDSTGPSPIAGAPSHPSTDEFNSDLVGRDSQGNVIPYRVEKGEGERKRRGTGGPLKMDTVTGKLEFDPIAGAELKASLLKSFPGVSIEEVLNKAAPKCARTPPSQWPAILNAQAEYCRGDARRNPRRGSSLKSL